MGFVKLRYGNEFGAYEAHIKVSTQKQGITGRIIEIVVKHISLFPHLS